MARDIERNPNADDDAGEAKPKRGLSDEEYDKQAAARLEEIHQYLSDRHDRREVVAQTKTRGGLELDWVPIESQVRNGKVAQPPEEDGPLDLDQGKQRAKLTQFELEHERAERGPDGTVPLVRRPIERLRPVVGLNDWLAKGPRANVALPPEDPREVALPGSGSTHKYASTSQSVTCYGTDGNINAWDPYCEWADEFSLGQLALSRGSGDSRQTLEVGHQQYRDLYGDWVPHLFVFYTTNNYTDQGDNKGGYNQDVDGWVQISASIHPEAKSSPVSKFDGTQYIMALKVELFEKNWWVRVNGKWIGYYPASLYKSGGLRSRASRVSWYGEIVDSAEHSGTTRTDMGNGHWPSEGFRRCAYMNKLRYQSSTGGSMSKYDGGSGYESHPDCYGLETHFSHTGSWGSHFYWGGSGKNSNCP